jgi:CRISPR-associated RAMP protein (TIGR02581 family)
VEAAMFDKFISSFVINFKVEPQTGFLIASGKIPIDPIEPDTSFVKARTTYSDYPLPYIPGSSFKGPIRAFTESLLRSKNQNAACDLGEGNCMKNYNNKKDSGIERYKHACLACRMFGSTKMASKLRFDDLLPYKSIDEIEGVLNRVREKSTIRNGIKIDRAKGTAAGGALFFYESITIPFYGSITAKNPEKWQLGLIFQIFDHINSGYIKFGHSKSRGMGRLKIEVESIDIAYTGEKLTFWDLNGENKGLNIEINGSGDFVKTVRLEKDDMLKFIDAIKDESKEELERAVNTKRE